MGRRTSAAFFGVLVRFGARVGGGGGRAVGECDALRAGARRDEHKEPSGEVLEQQRVGYALEQSEDLGRSPIRDEEPFVLLAEEAKLSRALARRRRRAILGTRTEREAEARQLDELDRVRAEPLAGARRVGARPNE